MCSSVAPLRPLPHFAVDHLTYQISPLPCLFSVWFLLLFPSASGDYFSTPLTMDWNDMVQILRSCPQESSQTLCPFWMLLRELHVRSHSIVRERKETCGEQRCSSWVLALVARPYAWGQGGLPALPTLQLLVIAWVGSGENSRGTAQQTHRNVRNFKKSCCFRVTKFGMVCYAAVADWYM